MKHSLWIVVLLLAACGGDGEPRAEVPSPSLQNVVFRRVVGGQHDLFVVKEDGSGERPLTSSPND
jgi:hypothetical protein